MYMQFAKVFDINEDQVLVTRDWNDEKDMYELSFTSDLTEMRVGFKLGFKDEDQCNIAFDRVDQAEALRMYNQLKVQVADLMEDAGSSSSSD